MITNFEQLSDMASLLTNEELNALAEKCKNLIKDRERIERKELRQKLMENLQKALSDIINNDFALRIINTYTDEDEEDHCVLLEPGDVYSVRIG